MRKFLFPLGLFFCFSLGAPAAEPLMPHWKCGTYKVNALLKISTAGQTTLELLPGSRSHTLLQLDGIGADDFIVYGKKLVQANVVVTKLDTPTTLAHAKLVKIFGFATHSAVEQESYTFLQEASCQ